MNTIYDLSWWLVLVPAGIILLIVIVLGTISLFLIKRNKPRGKEAGRKRENRHSSTPRKKTESGWGSLKLLAGLLLVATFILLSYVYWPDVRDSLSGKGEDEVIVGLRGEIPAHGAFTRDLEFPGFCVVDDIMGKETLGVMRDQYDNVIYWNSTNTNPISFTFWVFVEIKGKSCTETAIALNDAGLFVWP